MSFENKTVLLTGGASGIGHALSKLLVAKGANVFVLDLSAPQEPIEGVEYIECNITQSAAVGRAMAHVPSKVDILINNAGVMRRGRLFESSEEDWDLLFDVHVKGGWLVLKYALPKLQEGSMLVFMSSRHALYSPVDPAVYGIVKNTLAHIAHIVEESHPEFDVKVTYPGPTDTLLCRYGVGDEALKEKEKIMCSPDSLADHIVKLMESDKKKLVYNQETKEYTLE